jgi:signal transduction histidine kinase/DNA-binding response OmpR family regulator/ligand-binding sensor domain-containing protein
LNNHGSISNVRALEIDHNEALWIGTFKNGLFKMEQKNIITEWYHTQSYPNITDNSVRSLLVDQVNKVWIGTFHGLNILDRGKVTQVLSIQNDKSSISDNSIKKIFQDKDNIIWIGTYYGGVNRISHKAENFKNYTLSDEQNKFTGRLVSSFAQENADHFWVATEGSGLFHFDRVKNKFTPFLSNKNETFKNINIKKLLIHKDKLYVGLFNKGLSVVDINTRQVKHITVGNKNNINEPGNNVYDFLVMDSVIWVNAFGEGLEEYDPRTGHLKKLAHLTNKLSSVNIRAMVKSKTDAIWLGTERGLHKINKNNQKQTYKVRKFFQEEKIYTLYEENETTLWIGTSENGLYKFNPVSKKYSIINENYGLNGHSIFSIIVDEKDVWVSTESGISKINKNDYSVSNYGEQSDIKVSEFNNNASLKSIKGEFFFGGTDGFVMFNPKEIESPKRKINIVFSDLKQNNKIINPHPEGSILTANINDTKEIILPFSNSSFSLAYSTLDFDKQDNIQVTYKLENFDKEWKIGYANDELAYTIQKPGEYQLIMKLNLPGNTETNPKTLKIVVTPPFWQSKLAYLFYFIFSIIVLYSIWRYFNLTHKLQIENLQRLQQEQLNESKLRFFTNITHEFRTPLTMIFGPLQYLKSQTNDQNILQTYDVIQRNTTRLLALVNQILQFRKMASGHEKLSVSRNNLIDFLSNIFHLFDIVAKQNNINYSFIHPQDELITYFDSDKLEKVIFNLLANAFKFTNQGGNIDLMIEQDNTYTTIKVKDSGIGIPKELQEQIFMRFYEKSSHIHFEQKGTGIGLAISKELIEMHGGKLLIESEGDKGSTFIIKLKNSLNHFKADEIVQNTSGNQSLISTHDAEILDQLIHKDEDTTNQEGLNEDLINHWQEGLHHVLVVEDNEELRAFIITILKPHYNVLQAADGEAGLRMCLKYKPDVVLSDVMMPKMDGLSLLHQIKTKIEISHTSVILLSAKSASEEKIKGLIEGADDYLVKPFIPDELIIKIRKIIEIRKEAKEKFAKIITLDSKEITISDFDAQFIEKALEILEKNIHLHSYGIEQLAFDLAISRSVLFAKIKNLTDLTPNNFIKAFKLKRAAAILETGKFNVSEVCYKVGFKDQKYFRKIFFEEFGVNPSDYEKSKQSTDL